MNEVDMIIERARHANGAADGDRCLSRLVPVVDALRLGGLSYAMDWHKPAAFELAADAGRSLGAGDLARVLTAAADIARSPRNLRLDRAIAAFDDRCRPATIAGLLHDAIISHRQRHQDAFDPVPSS